MDRGPRRGVFDKRSQVRQLKESVQSSGHKTGLTPRLLHLFAPHPPLQFKKPAHKRKPKVPYSGFAACVEKFAEPGDPEYQPENPDRPPEPRLFRNREFPAQARVDLETKPEK